jgi:integrase
MVGTRRREIGLGGFPEFSLADARDRARGAREAIRRGVDPVEERKAARSALAAAQRRGLTFSAAVERFLPTRLEEFRNPKHRAQWRSTLDTYAKPTLGDMLVQDIEVAHVLDVLSPFWLTKTETANRVRTRIEAVLSWAAVAGHRKGENPARWKDNLAALLPKQAKVAKVENNPAISLSDAPAWFAALRAREGVSTRALEFLAMTAARSGEVRGVAWLEVDLEAGMWTVPAARMKMDREHRVPLTREAVDLLRALPRQEGSPHVFPSPRGKVLSDMSLSAVMRRMHADAVKAGELGWLDTRNGRPAVPHGLRSTFRDWAAERTGYPSDMAEIALAHRVGGEVERAYRRGDMVEKRRRLMSDWDRFLRGEAPGKVSGLRRAG